MHHLQCTRILGVALVASGPWKPQGPVFNQEKKSNTKSLIEDKIVEVDNFLTQVIWTKFSLKYQIYEIRDNVIYQDNKSAIKSDNNCRQSYSERNLHMNIIYYFITERIMKQEESVQSCPNLDMIRDYFTKALQGYKFCHFCNIILGIHEYNIPSCNVSGRALVEY